MSRDLSPAVRVARGASYLYVQGIVVSLLGVVYFALATRILSVGEVGVVAALGMVTSFFVTFGTFAIPSAATKYVSEFFGRGRFGLAKGVYKKVVLCGFIASIIFSFICGASSYVISIILNGQRYQFLIILLAFDVFALVFSPYLNGILSGLQKFREISIFNVISSSLRFGCALFLLYKGYGVLGVVIGWIIGDFIGLILRFPLIYVSFKGESAPLLFSNLFKYSLPLYASDVLGYFTTYVDRFLILFFTGLSTLGIYSIAITAIGVVALVSSSLGAALFPQLSELYGRGEGALKDASVRASRYVSLVYTPLSVGLAAVAYPTINLFVGVRYVDAAIPLAIISLCTGLTCLSVAVNAVLLSLSETRVFLESNVLSILADIVVCLIFLPYLGVVGAAFGRVALIIVGFGYCAYRLKRIHGFYFDKEAFLKSWLGSIVMGVAVILFELLLLDTHLLPVYVLLGGIVYLFMLRVLQAITMQDIILTKMFLPKFLNGVVDGFARFFGVKREGGEMG